MRSCGHVFAVYYFKIAFVTTTHREINRYIQQDFHKAELHNCKTELLNATKLLCSIQWTKRGILKPSPHTGVILIDGHLH